MTKVKASAIYYALFLSVIIALILGSMILYSNLNRQFGNFIDVREILMDNAKSGIAYGQANFRELPYNNPMDLRLFGEKIDSVKITKKQWGAFTILSSEAHHNNQTYSKIALCGEVNNETDPNLFIADQGRAISICGETRIEGLCHLPKSGIKRAYIEGKNYTGTEMVYGRQLVSASNLPPIDDDFINHFEDISGNIFLWDDNEDTIHNSFENEAIHYINDNVTSLENIYVSGHVIIESKDSIFVGASTKLNNVILKSKVVYIEEGFVGTAQIIASKKIILEENVTLLYPSVLGLIEDEFPKKKSSEIMIADNSMVFGSVFLLSRESNFRKPVQLSIGHQSEVDGLVYCQGKTQLKGKVNGALYSQKFYLKTPSSSYENHLLDAQILDQLPEDFVYINLLQSTNQLKRIEWLN